MIVLAVDLAASMSAWCVMDDGQVCHQDDSFGRSESEVISRLAQCAESFDVEHIVVEDLPHRLPFASLVKAVCRMQGRFVHELSQRGLLDKLIFVPPALWQRYFPGVWRQGAAGAQAVAESKGYQAPDLRANDPRFSVEGLSGKERASRRAADRKISTDYVDAFLIGMWATEVWDEHGTLDVPQTQRYIR